MSATIGVRVIKKFWILLTLFAGTLCLFVFYTHQDMYSHILWYTENIITEKTDFHNKITKLKIPTSIKKSDNNIFFIETTCGTEDLLISYNFSTGINLNPRQCCAIESAAITNKNHNIYILNTCPLNMTVYEQSPEYIKKMLSLPNVYLVALTLKEYFHGSPVYNLYQSNKISSSSYALEHLSDVLRFLTLWKYGGTYLDLDTITIR